jgi:Cd2+/Zn2+-exporting ATPase
MSERHEAEAAGSQAAGAQAGEARAPGSPASHAPTSPFLVPVLVLLGLVGGALLEWVPADPSVWRWAPFGLAYLVGGGPIVRGAWATLRQGKLSIDLLMGVAALGAAGVGEPLEGAVLLFLFTLSGALEARALGRTRKEVEALVALRPEEARLVEPGSDAHHRMVAVASLCPGDLVRVRPGERIPADGRVVEGSGAADQSAITGESLPVAKAGGDPVFAATILLGGAVTVEVTREASETMLARIIAMVEEAREARAPAQRFIDRFAHPYTVAVLVGTSLYAIVPPLFLGWEWAEAFYRAMTLLVVASPCALVISTPAAILSGIARGARMGILFKGGAVLDRAAAIQVVAFDKTGTLTRGQASMVDRIATSPDAPDFLPAVAALEADSEHHLASAVIRALEAEGGAPDPRPVRDFTALPGEGVAGLLGEEPWWVGNSTMAGRMEATVPETLAAWARAAGGRGESAVYVGRGAEVRGAMAFADTLKPDARDAVQELRSSGVRRVVILSGDHLPAVQALARALGVEEFQAGLLPDQKVEAVKALARAHPGVAMVGDGVNDAPAMAASHLGVAMGAAGTEVAIETADVVLMGHEVGKVHEMLRLARRAQRVVRQNVWFSVGWMALLVAVAGTVGMPLTVAVIAHEGSTLLVALNGLRLLRPERR